MLNTVYSILHTAFTMRSAVCCILLLSCLSALGDAIVPEERLATNQWQAYTGVRGGIPHPTTISTTISPGSGTAFTSAFQSAINSAASNSVIQLLAGTYAPNSSLYMDAAKGLVIRGTNAYPPTSIWAPTLNTGSDPYIACRKNYHEQNDAQIRKTAWTAGFTRGTTTITVTSTNGMRVGWMGILQQLNDDANGATAFGGEGLCGTCDLETYGTNVQNQHFQITSLSGTSVGITPPIFYTNWQAALSTRVLWTDDQNSDEGNMNGIENLWMTTTNDVGSYSSGWKMIEFRYTFDNWVSNCTFHEMPYHGVKITEATFWTLAGNSFISNKTHGSQCYAVAIFGGCSGLIIDNIFAPYTSGINTAGGGEGIVEAYNFMTNSEFEAVSSVAIASSHGFHGGYANNCLVEGNWSSHFDGDNIHGSSGFITALRNRLVGYQVGKSAETVPVEIAGSNYNYNIVGNILGWSGYQANYDTTNGAGPTKNTAIFALNFWDASSAGSDHYDTQVQNTLLRKGNYNVVTAGIPSGESVGTTNVADSFLFSSKPSFFGFLQWPPFDATVPGRHSETNIPAGYRYRFGSNPPVATYGPTSTPAPGRIRARKIVP